MSDLITGQLLHWHSHSNSLACALDRSRTNRIMSRTDTHFSNIILFYCQCVHSGATEFHRRSTVVLCKWYRISIQKGMYKIKKKTCSSPLLLQILCCWIQGIGHHRGPASATQLFWTANVPSFSCIMDSLFDLLMWPILQSPQQRTRPLSSIQLCVILLPSIFVRPLTHIYLSIHSFIHSFIHSCNQSQSHQNPKQSMAVQWMLLL